MSGTRITDRQVRLYMTNRKSHTQETAAAKSGMSERTARRIEHNGKLPSQTPRRYWRSRPDPFADVWESEVVPLLRGVPKLKAVTLLRKLQEDHPERFPDSMRRTLERDISQWRALEGPGKEVFFPQTYQPGVRGLSDFTHMEKLGVTIAGVAFGHLLYHFVLAFSRWKYASVVDGGESFQALAAGLQNALWQAGGCPSEHRSDSLSAFRLFTGHQTDRKMFPKDMLAALPDNGKKNVYYKDTPGDVLKELWRRYKEAIEPLRVAGKLGAVHFQFAPWVINNPDGRAHVEHCADVMEGYAVAAEFRHRSWFSEENADSTLAMERERGLINVIVDEPQGPTNSIPAVWEVTNPTLALVRLHGRNHETWNIKDAPAASARFNYDYTDEELGELSSRIIEISKHVGRTHVVFNNNFEDQGQRNARTLMGVLGNNTAA